MKFWSRLHIVVLINLSAISFVHAGIVDNTDPGFSTVGSWSTSSFTPGFYGSNYRFASAGSGSRQAIWSFSVVAGQYELSAQWAAFDNRASNAVYRVYNNSVELGMQLFDQRINGGQFNVFDTSYVLEAGTLEVVLTDNADGYVIADAIELAYLGAGGNLTPNGMIDTPAGDITVIVGDNVNFTGSGSDPDNNLPLSFNWDFGDPAIADATVEDPGSVQFNNLGSFTVTFTVTDSLGLSDPTPATVVVNVQSLSSSVIVDNTDPGFSTLGSWGTSTATSGFYGSNYRFASAGSGSRQAIWSFSVVAGQYELSAQWAAFDNRASNAVYRVYNNSVELGMQLFDQRINGGQFNVFDTSYVLEAGTLEVVLTDNADGYVIADAIELAYLGAGGNLTPNGMIDTPAGDITVIVGDNVNFTGSGSDPDNNLPLSFNWDFGDPAIADATVEDPGSVQFNNLGSFTVTFTVTDSLGLSDPTPATVVVNVQSLSSSVIVDNTDPGFSTLGSWGTSTATSGFYGSNYRFASAGSGSRQAIWSFSVVAGQYELSAQWAAFDNRASNAVYRVYNNSVELGMQLFDQRINGGQFNVFDTSYVLEAGTLEVVLTDNADGYVIADAIELAYLGAGGNLTPNGMIDTPAGDITVIVGDNVNFTGSGSDPDNNLPLSFNWDFGDPAIADATVEDPGSVQFNNLGSFTVTFTVTDSLGLSDPTPATVVVNVQSLSSSVIVDNTDPGFTTVGNWGTSSTTPGYYGSNYSYIDYSWSANTATWSANLADGKYDIFAHWSAFSNRASNAKFTIFNNGTEQRIFWADQRFDGGQFNILGSFYLQNSSLEIVLSLLLKTNGFLIADAIKFENICQADPCVYILTPQDFHLQPSGSLYAAANVQTSGSTSNYGVRFVLDEGTPDEQEVLDLTNSFEASFTIPVPSQTEHRLDVYLTDSSGNQLYGLNSHDYVTPVGVGNYDVVMGDSTADGFGDDNITDDTSGDMRNGGGGYAPVLNDLLTAYYSGVPHTIVNEGAPGTLSADGVAIVNSLLAKHPLAQRFLLMYGMNDARAFPRIPSGLGLSPGHPDYPGTYKHNLQQMIDPITGAGKEVGLATILIALGNSYIGPQYPDPGNPPADSRGLRIIEYNLVVDELVGVQANNITASPDLWTKFNEIITGGQRRYEVEYADNIHPNGEGYRTTAEEWKKAITEN